jgi:hypothetical protein
MTTGGANGSHPRSWVTACTSKAKRWLQPPTHLREGLRWPIIPGTKDKTWRCPKKKTKTCVNNGSVTANFLISRSKSWYSGWTLIISWGSYRTMSLIELFRLSNSAIKTSQLLSKVHRCILTCIRPKLASGSDLKAYSLAARKKNRRKRRPKISWSSLGLKLMISLKTRLGLILNPLNVRCLNCQSI